MGSVGINLPAEPDWHAMDYSDIVSIEACRNGQFGHAVRTRLHEIRQSYQYSKGSDGLRILAEVLAGKVQISASGAAVFTDVQNFAEFLEARSDASVSGQHASWLAFLIWLHDAGYSLRAVPSETEIQFILEASVIPVAPDSLASWIDQFCN
jgi:two-component system probable response regulator PhcQ